MNQLFKIWVFAFSIPFICIGFLMLVAPKRYPYLYAGFESMSRRAKTERGRELAIRMQGLMALAVGCFMAFFVCARWDGK